MNLEKQVCSLELTKRLKELGVKQESYFSWFGAQLKSREGVELDLKNYGLGCYGDVEIYSAFTVAELGEMLPLMLFEKHRCGKWVCMENLFAPRFIFDSNEANARARMVIYLIEQGLLNVVDLSKHS